LHFPLKYFVAPLWHTQIASINTLSLWVIICKIRVTGCQHWYHDGLVTKTAAKWLTSGGCNVSTQSQGWIASQWGGVRRHTTWHATQDLSYFWNFHLIFSDHTWPPITAESDP
jgi:hypothetical protein